MIEDNELRNLFQAESEERLKSLEEGLRKLEDNPQDKEAIESAFRDAHTIKGSARMLEIQSIEVIAHQLENDLDAIRKGKLTLSLQIIQSMYESLYAIQQFVNEAITGKTAHVDIPTILKALELKNLAGKEEVPSMRPEITAAEKIEITAPLPPTTKKEEPLPVKQEEKPIKKWERPYSIATVRIDMQQISNLMNQAASLTVSKNRMVRLFERIEELLDTWETKYRAYQQRYTWASYSLSNQNIDSKSQDANTTMIDLLREIGTSLEQLRNDAYEDIHKLEAISSSFTHQVQKLSLIPLSKLFDLFLHMMRDLAQTTGKEIEFIIKGGEITVDKKIVEDMKDPLMHLLRNAVSHGIETPEQRLLKGKPSQGTIQLIGRQAPTSIFIEVMDDGGGLDTEKIRDIAIKRQIISEKEAEILTVSEVHSLIFLPGFSTASQVTNISGRGVGLDVVKNQVEKLNGSIIIDSVLNQGCRFSIELPITHMTTQVILTKINHGIYALPMDMIETCLLVTQDQIYTVEGRDVIVVQDHPISLISLKNLIGSNEESLPKAEKSISAQPCIIITMQEKRMALVVDAILDEQKVVVIPLNRLLRKMKSILGTTILKTGEVCIILNPFEFIHSVSKEPTLPIAMKEKKPKLAENKKTILVVDDSYTARLILKQTLEKEGYNIITAENGKDALNKLAKNPLDAVITDIEMPEMNGLTLTTAIRSQPLYYTLPIILLTSLSSDKDRQRGREVGANAYFIKTKNEQPLLLQTLKNLLNL